MLKIIKIYSFDRLRHPVDITKTRTPFILDGSKLLFDISVLVYKCLRDKWPYCETGMKKSGHHFCEKYLKTKLLIFNLL